MSQLHSSSPTPSRSDSSEGASDGIRALKASGSTVVKDWSGVSFVVVDSFRAKKLEDAVWVRGNPDAKNRDDWSAELKVIHPLPLSRFISLREGVNQVCLGIQASMGREGEAHPSVAFVKVRNFTRLTGSQANVILAGQERTDVDIADETKLDQELCRRLKTQLNLVRATALRLSQSDGRALKAERSVDILMKHAQVSAIRASRKLSTCPSLIVLRAGRSGLLTRKEAREELGLDIRDISFSIAPGKTVPTILRPGEEPLEDDKLRLKERGNSGAINFTQIACALLGLDPLPDELVQQGLTPDSMKDLWKREVYLPDALCKAITEKRHEIRTVLEKLVGKIS